MRNRLKLLLVGLSGLVLLLVAAAVVVPVLFRDRVDALIKARLTAVVDADVNWQSLDLSLVKGFPHLTVTARQIRVCNRAPFAGVCLAQIDEASARLSLLSLITHTIDVRTVILQRARVQLDVREDGLANWQVTRPDPDAAAPDASRPFRVALHDYRIEDAHIVYVNRATAVYGELVGLDHHGRGDLSRADIALETTTHADGASLRIGTMTYLRDARVDVDAKLQVDVPTRRITLRDNHIRVNDLTLGIEGSAARTDAGLALDLRWSSRTDDLRSLVSLLPTRLVGSLEGLETAGTVAVTGYAKGTYGENTVPAVDLRVSVANGRFKYAALPAGVDQIAMEATIAGTPARDWDALVLDVPRFTARVAGHPVDGRLRLATFVSDPAVDVAFRSSLDLADLTRVVPFQAGDTLGGHADADVRLEGRVSTLKKGQYHRFGAEGYVNVRDLVYQRKASAQGLRAAALSLTFNPRHLQLLADGAGLGATEVTIRGRFEDYLTWWLADDVLRGTFEVSGGVVDLAGLLRQEDAATGNGTTAPASRIVQIPAALDVTIAAAARRVSYGPIELGGLRGSLRLHDRRADLRDLGFGVFGGNVTVNGSYDTRVPARPAVSLSYDAKAIDIQQAARQSLVLRAVAPIALSAIGTFNSTLELTGALDPTLALDFASLTGRGTVNSSSLRLDRFTPLVSLAKSLRLGQLEHATLGDIRFSFVLRDGRMVTSPFETQLGDLQLRVGGSTAFAGQAIDYDVTGRVPTSAFGEGARERIGEWLGPAAAAGVLPASVGLTARLTGTVAQPSVTVAFDAGAVASGIRGAAMAKARAEADRLLADAEAQAAGIRREAEEAAGRLRAEGDEAAERLLAAADTPLKRAAARLAAARVRQEAASRAGQLVTTASARATALVDAARRTGADRIESATPR